MLTKTQVARIEKVSPSYVSKVITGEIDGHKAERIKELLTLKEEDFLPFFADEVFLELCNVAIMKGKTVEVRKRAVILHEMAVKLIQKSKV